jgi:hypothetical protein
VTIEPEELNKKKTRLPGIRKGQRGTNYAFKKIDKFEDFISSEM